jgi:hypothetical protein
MPPPIAAPPMAAPDDSGWKTNRLGIRYRLANPTAAAPVTGEGEEPIWPDEEADPDAVPE